MLRAKSKSLVILLLFMFVLSSVFSGGSISFAMDEPPTGDVPPTGGGLPIYTPASINAEPNYLNPGYQDTSIILSDTTMEKALWTIADPLSIQLIPVINNVPQINNPLVSPTPSIVEIYDDQININMPSGLSMGSYGIGVVKDNVVIAVAGLQVMETPSGPGAPISIGASPNNLLEGYAETAVTLTDTSPETALWQVSDQDLSVQLVPVSKDPVTGANVMGAPLTNPVPQITQVYENTIDINIPAGLIAGSYGIMLMKGTPPDLTPVAVAGLEVMKPDTGTIPKVWLSTEGKKPASDGNGTENYSSSRAPLTGGLLDIGVNVEQVHFTQATFEIKYDSNLVWDPDWYDPPRTDLTARDIAYSDLADGWRKATITLTGDVTVGEITNDNFDYGDLTTHPTLFELRFAPKAEGTIPLGFWDKGAGKLSADYVNCNLQLLDGDQTIQLAPKLYNDDLVLFTFTDKSDVKYYFDYNSGSPLTGGKIFLIDGEQKTDLGIQPDQYGGYFFNSQTGLNYQWYCPGYDTDNPVGFHYTSWIQAGMLMANPHMLPAGTNDVALTVYQPGIGTDFDPSRFSARISTFDSNWQTVEITDKTVNFTAVDDDSIQLTFVGGLQLLGDESMQPYNIYLFKSGNLLGRVYCSVGSYNEEPTGEGLNVNATVTRGGQPFDAGMAALQSTADIPVFYQLFKDPMNQNPALTGMIPAGNYRLMSVAEAVYMGDPGKITPPRFIDLSTLAVEVSINTDNAANLTIAIPDDNVYGHVYQGSSLISQGYLELQYQAEDSATIPSDPSASMNLRSVGTQIDADGSFKLLLGPGTYQPAYVYMPEGMIDISAATPSFTVTGTKTEPSQVGNMDIVLPALNVNGTVVEEDQTPVAGAWMQINQMDTGMVFWACTNNAGEFQLNLSDGNYKIFGISRVEKYTSMDLDFTVAEGELTTPLNIILPKGLIFTGSILDENNQPINNAWVQVTPVRDDTSAGCMDNLWAGSQADGSFSLELKPGIFAVTGISTPLRWIQTHLPFKIGDDKKLYLPDPDAADAWILADPQNLTVKIPALNVKGQVLDSDGSSPVQFAWIDLQQKDTENNWQYIPGISTDEQGNYSVQLGQGTYRIKGVSTPKRWVELGRTSDEFTIVDPVQPIVHNIILPGPNVKGLLRDENANPMAYSWVSFNPVTSSQVNNAESKWAQTDEFGYFEQMLAPGVYQVAISAAKYVELKDRIVVPETGTINLNLNLPRPNVRGVLRDEEENALINAWISIEKDSVIPVPGADPAGTPIMPENMFWAQTDGQGSFAIDLADGNYRITGVSTMDRWIQMNIAFQAPVDNLSVNLPGSNVKGRLSQNSVPLGNAWINITGWDSASNTEKPGLFKNALTDAAGNYKVNLEPGTYKFSSLSMAERWMDLRDLTEPFTVTAADTASNPRIIDLSISNNVSGSVYGDNGTKLANAWFSLAAQNADPAGSIERWLQTDSNGDFETSLKPGDYVVTGISAPDRWIDMEQEFTVPDSANINLEIRVQNTVTGKIYASDGTTPQSSAWVNIVGCLETGESDWNRTYWAQTGSDGQFSLNLKDGSYRVFGISTLNRWVEMAVDFSISGGVSTPNPLNINLPGENFSGTVKKSSGSVVPRAGLSLMMQNTSGGWDWANWLETNENGQFSDSLMAAAYPATYRIAGISAEGKWIELPDNGQYQFTLENSSSKLENYEIVLPDPNVSGIFRNADGTPVANGWLEVASNQNLIIDWAKSYYTQTNANGCYELTLNPGSYIFTHAYDGNQWIDLGGTENQITVPSTGTITKDISLQAPNISGVVIGTDGSPVTSGWVQIVGVADQALQWATPYWADINAEGIFNVALANGDWIVTGIYVGDNWFNLKRDMDRFTVENGTAKYLESVNNIVQSDSALRIELPSASVHGAVTINGSPAPGAWVAARLRTDAVDNWTNVIWSQADNSGSFEMVLDNISAYCITDVNTVDKWYTLTTPLNLEPDQAANVIITEP